MSNVFPLSIDVEIYNQNDHTYITRRVPWVDTPTLAAIGEVIIQYQDNGNTAAGLYLKGETTFRIGVFYKYLEDLVVNGGVLKLYYDLKVPVQADANTKVFRNGFPSEDTTLKAGGSVWVTILYGSASAGVGAVKSVNGKTGVVNLTTTDIPEGTNLYYTGARVTADAPVKSVNTKTGVVALTTTDVPEGTNLYYTGQRVAADAPVKSVNTKTGVVALTTTDVPQGTNLYYTNALAAAAAPVQKVAGRTGDVVLVVADVAGAAPLVSPALTGVPTSINPAWPVAYDDPNPNGGGYYPTGVSTLATRDLLKAAVAGSLGNYSSIMAIDETVTTIPPTSSGALWVINYQSNTQNNCTLPDLSAINYPDPDAANGITFRFANLSKYSATLLTGQNRADIIRWGGDQLITEAVVNPGETLGLTIVWYNRVLTWVVSGGTALPQASNTYTVLLSSGVTAFVPAAAMSKSQILMTGALTQVLDTNNVIVPSVLSLPTDGAFILVNRTTGNQSIYVRNTSFASGQTLTLIANTNAHVVTGSYGVLAASNAISGAYPLYAPISTPKITLFYAALLYDVLVITDDTQGDMTMAVDYVFDPAVAKTAGNWVFFNDLKQPNPKAITISDTFGTTIPLAVGASVTILYTPDYKIYSV